jgi:DNA-binding transcriptional LysR family regulator
MNLDQLKYFLAAARFQHVGKAARFVHISPSAISGAILSLEREIGCDLFLRTGKRIQLNTAGRQLVGRAEAILHEVQRLPSEISGEGPALEGLYRLGASHFLSSRFMAPAWFELQERHPGLVGELCSLGTSIVIGEILRGSLDYGLCFSPLHHPDLLISEIVQDELVIAVSESHPLLRTKKPIDLKNLNRFPAVLHKASQGIDLCEEHPVFEKFGIVPLTKNMFDSDDSAIECLRLTDSWSLLPKIVVQQTKGIRNLKVPANWKASYSICLASRRSHSNHTLREALLSELNKLLKRI